NNLPFEKKNTLQTIVINDGNARILHNQMKKVFSLQKSIDEQMSGLSALQAIYRSQRVYIFILLSSLLLTLVLGAFLWKSLRAKQAANRSLELKNQEILEHERQLVEMSDEVRRATQAKVDFFTNVSHEFRTPLNLILGFAEDLLPSKKLSKDEQQGISHIRQNAFRLLRLVNQLMDFRKTESGQMKLQASENDLVAFVQNIMESYKNTAQKRGIEFQLLTRHEQIPVWFDASMMDKVLFNLLSNAFKFTPDGGKIHLSISVDTFENRVKLSVEDNGKGMSEQELAHVFEPFYQGEERQLTGTGLGLSLSKSLVELHGGSISVKSSKGKGSRFTVSLPLDKVHLDEEKLPVGNGHPAAAEREFLFEAEDASLALTAILPETAVAEMQQILVIEDNEDLQFFLKKKLSPAYQI
ncbi:MAG: HAMP domain-containing sensor histidine kinase, partial [Bacteroidota bacterium]